MKPRSSPLHPRWFNSITALLLAVTSQAAQFRSTPPSGTPPSSPSGYQSNGSYTNSTPGLIQVVQIRYTYYNTSWNPLSSDPQFYGPVALASYTLNSGDTLFLYSGIGPIPHFSFYNGSWNIDYTNSSTTYSESTIVTSSYAPNNAPSAGISGSTLLSVGEVGTWNFSASDPDTAPGNGLAYWWFHASTNNNNNWSPTSGSPSGSHSQSFPAAGKYRWYIEAKDGQGLTASDYIDVTVTAPDPTYSLTVTAGTGGTATGSATGLAGNANPSISASPSAGYTFTGWSGDPVANSSAGSTTVPMNNANRSVTATFTVIPVTYSLTVSAGSGGTASGSASGLSGSASPSISASPNAGYAFAGWSGDPVANSSAATTTVPMNNANRSVTATFTVIPVTYSLTVSAGSGGTASGSASGLSGSASPSISASPNAGYAFAGWTGSPVTNSSAASTTVPINNANRSVTATYTAIPATYSLTVSAGSGGTASGSASGLSGSASPSISASPNAGYIFNGWTGDPVTNSSAATTTVPINSANRTVTATFTPTPTTYYTLTVIAGSGGTASGSASTLSGSANPQISATANSGFTFAGWTGDPVANSSAPSTTVPMNNANRTVTATFAVAPTTYSLTVNASAGGTASGSASGLFSSANPSITAAPNAGYSFAGWTGDPVANSSAASTTVPINSANRTVTATFSAIPSTYSLTVNAGVGGTASGSASGLSGSANPAISATPGSGYTFAGWTGDPVANSSAASTTVPINSANRSVTATFTPTATTYSLTVSAGGGGSASGSSSGLAGNASPTIVATPSAGYTFSRWTGDAVTNSTTASTTVPINNSNRSVTATFTANGTISVDFSLPSSVTRPLTGSTPVNINFTANSPSSQLTEYTWSATASDGSSLGSASSWTAFQTTTQDVYVSSGYYTQVTHKDLVTAGYWTPNGGPVDWDLYATWNARGQPRIWFFAPDGVTSGYYADYNIEVYWRYVDPVYKTYTTNDWVDTSHTTTQTVPAQLANGSVSKTITITQSTALGPITVIFTARDSQGRSATLTRTTIVVPPVSNYALTVTTAGSGSATGSGTYPSGATATITATPAAGWQLQTMSGAISSTTSPANVLMDADKAVLVTFTPQTYLLTTSTSGAGSVTPGGSYTYNSWVNITASPNIAAWFSGWVGDASGTTNPLMVQMTTNKNIVANFSSKLPNAITFPSPGNQLRGSIVALAAVASSGLPVTYVVTSGPAIVSGSALTVTGLGQITVAASQSGNAMYLAAADVGVSFTGFGPSAVQVKPKQPDVQIQNDQNKAGASQIIIH